MGAYIKTDKDISYVDWYVNGKYERASMPNSGTTELYYYPNTLTGDIRGIKYRIKAVVWRYDDQGNMHSDSDSYTLRVYKLEVETKVPRRWWSTAPQCLWLCRTLTPLPRWMEYRNGGVGLCP